MEASTVTSARMMGALLVEKKIITNEQLEQALLVQQENGGLIGEILVEEFDVSRVEIAGVLAEQWTNIDKAERAETAARAERMPPEPVEPLASTEVRLRRPLGQILVEYGFVTEQQIEAALAAQSSSPSRLGEILIEQGVITRMDLASALAEQWSPPPSASGATSVAATANEPSPEKSPTPVAPVQVWSEEDRVLVAELDQRLRVIERSAGGMPWQEDLRLVTFDLRAAIGNVERRLENAEKGGARAELGEALEAVSARIEALEGASTEAELAAVRQELEEQKTRPVTVAGLEEIRAAIARLEERPDPVDEVSQLAEEISVLAARLDQLTGVEALEAKLETIAGQTEAAQAGFAGLERRLDELAGLQSRLDAVADRVPDASLLDELAQRIDEAVASSAGVDTVVLTARIDALEQDGLADSTALERLTAELGELRGRTEEQLAELASLGADGSSLEDLRARVDELAGRVVEPDRAPLEELRARVEELAGRVVEPDRAPLEELRARVDELASVVGHAPEASLLEDLRARVEELAGRMVEPDTAQIDELRSRVEQLAVRVIEPDTAALDALRARVEELAGRVVEPDTTPLDGLQAPLDELRARVEELAGRVAEPETAQLDELQQSVQQLQELAAAAAPDHAVAALEARVAELEQIAARMPAEDLRTDVQRLAESTVVECRSLMEVLSARVDELVTAVPPEQDLLELRSQVDELAAHPTDDQGLRARVDELAARLEDLGKLEPAVADIRASLDGLDSVRADDAAATGARLADLAGAVDSLADLESRVRESFDRKLADHADEVASRLDVAESRLDALASLDERVAAFALQLDQRPDGEALTDVAAELREELAALAARPVVADPADRLDELSRRIEGAADSGRERIDGVAEGLNLRVSQLAEELGHRLDGFGERTNGLVTRDEAATAAGEHADWVRSEIEALREFAAAQVTSVDAAVAKAGRADASSREELSRRLDESVAAIRCELDAHGDAVAGNTSETAALQARVEELHQAMSDRAAWEARFESALDERLDTLATRIADEVAGARDDATRALRAVRDEMSPLTARIDELHTLRDADQQAARAGDERLAERIEEVAEVQEDSWEATRATAQDLAARLEASAAALRAEAAEARAAAGELTGRIDDLHELRTDDLAAAELAGAELAARLDDHAVRSAAETLELERVLRHEIDGIAARLEASDASGLEAREELRGELERLASSVGWRLERIEESLASDQTAELQARVAELAGRLDEQAALGEEQVRVTERALRKGLASLGERLVDTELAYADAGNALRRSIERLGAAVVEADARMADQVPVSEAEGCVAFAPTPDGYRLVEIPGTPPEIGSEVVLEVCDGPLVVTRYGRSPLPLDGRPCAYLDRR